MEDRSVLVDELNFFFGVCNVMFSSWLAGAFPFGYWIYHSIKIFILMIIRLVDFSSRKQQFWLLDYCYVVNYLILLYYLLSIAGVCPWPKVVFRILFTSCVGPLALSVAAFRNSLVFHSSKNIVILAVHFSPNVALWYVSAAVNQAIVFINPPNCCFQGNALVSTSIGQFISRSL